MKVFIALFAAFLPALLPAAEVAPAAKPNIIVILADDMGYSDPGCYGGEMSTPAIDRLAKEGVRLTHFHNGGMCVVSRASLLTGKWWPRALPEFQQTRLLPERLHDNGYRTGLIGKWHLDGDPMDRGFDHFFGFLDGFADHFTGAKSYRLDREPFTEFGPDYYSSDAFSDRAVEFIQSPPADQKNKPFFLYLSYQAPHNPLQASKQDIMKYRGKYSGGWQAVREARFKRQKELGIVPADAVLPDAPQNLPNWESLSPEQRDLEDLRMSVYAAMIERMDHGIGRVIKSLFESGKAENTLVIFMSDNGADSFSLMDGPMLKQGKLPGDPQSNWQPGTGWAYTAVTPWRLYKISQHSGGVTTGAVAWWPAGKLGSPGRIQSAPIHMVDMLPTLLEISKSPAAEGRLAGESFLPMLKGTPWKRQKPLFFQYLDNRAIRTAEWTLAEVDGTGWELFNAATDPLETKNLAAAKPELVASLTAQWQDWWRAESEKPDYIPESSKSSQHYKPQGDHGSGAPYLPSAMPEGLSNRYPRP
jgi:arylsulfatase A-like enzyme